jgi:hypothetical protein
VLVESAMFAYLAKLLLLALSRLRSRASLEAENLVLRQQVIVSSRKPETRRMSDNHRVTRASVLNPELCWCATGAESPIR